MSKFVSRLVCVVLLSALFSNTGSAQVNELATQIAFKTDGRAEVLHSGSAHKKPMSRMPNSRIVQWGRGCPPGTVNSNCGCIRYGAACCYGRWVCDYQCCGNGCCPGGTQCIWNAGYRCQ
jgi:hypothetical protein